MAAPVMDDSVGSPASDPHSHKLPINAPQLQLKKNAFFLLLFFSYRRPALDSDLHNYTEPVGVDQVN